MLTFICILGTVLLLVALFAAVGKKTKIVLGIIAIILLVLFIKSCNEIEEEATVANFATAQSFTG